MALRRKRNLTTDLDAKARATIALQKQVASAGRMLNAMRRPSDDDRGPSPTIPTMSGHCHACDAHMDDGHYDNCPVAIAQELNDPGCYHVWSFGSDGRFYCSNCHIQQPQTAGPSLPNISDIPPMQGVTTVTSLPAIGMVGQCVFNRTDGTLWVWGPPWKPAGTI